MRYVRFKNHFPLLNRTKTQNNNYPLMYIFSNFLFFTNDFDKEEVKEKDTKSLKFPFNFTKYVNLCKKESNNIYNIKNEVYEDLRKIIGKYLDDPEYVYKSCLRYGTNYLVILKRRPDTITNEGRKNIIDASKAAYRGNKFDVVMIIDIYNPKMKINEVTSTFMQKGHCNNRDRYSTITYKVGKLIEPDKEYLNDNNIVYGSGIHFFTDVLRAISYKNSPPCTLSNFTGVWNEYLDSGEIVSSYNYENGCKISTNIGSSSNNSKVTLIIGGTLIIFPILLIKIGQTIRITNRTRKLLNTYTLKLLH